MTFKTKQILKEVISFQTVKKFIGIIIHHLKETNLLDV